MKGRNVVAALALSFALAAAQASGSVPIVDHGRVVLVTDAQAANPKAMKSAIVAGSSELGWHVVDDKPGKLRIKYDKGAKHSATVDVLYDGTGYEIKYVDSYNLKYDGSGMIHNTYNRWTANLIKYIGQAHGRSAQ